MLLLQLGNHVHAVVVTGAAGRVQIELARPLRLRIHISSGGVQHFTTLDTELVGDGGALSVAGWRWECHCRRPHGAASQHTPALSYGSRPEFGLFGRMVAEIAGHRSVLNTRCEHSWIA